MKAIILKETGGTEHLMLKEIEKPQINKHEVLVKVEFIGINPVDVKSRGNQEVLHWIMGEQNPMVLGWDISGTIVGIGSAVKGFDLADKVFGLVNFLGAGNAYAEYVSVPTDHLCHIPENTSFSEAAASPMVASTAHQALVDTFKIKKGQNVLIHGASGGVGHMAVQIAKYYGAHVVGTSSSRNRDFVLSLGADKHIDYTSMEFKEHVENMDLVIDTVQGDTLRDSVDIVRPGGMIITLPSPEIPKEVQELAQQKNVNIRFIMVESRKETMTALANLLGTGDLKPHIHKIFPFSEMDKAHLEVETNHVRGKVVVSI